MLLIAIVLCLVVMVCWLLFSSLEIKIDTRIPSLTLHWKTIAKLKVVFEDGEWWLRIFTLPYKNQWLIAEIVKAKRGKEKKNAKDKKPKPSTFPVKKVITLLSGSRVMEWKIAIDTGDYPVNAWLFALTVLPPFQQHLDVNFVNRNFLFLRIVHSPWRLLKAWIK